MTDNEAMCKKHQKPLQFAHPCPFQEDVHEDPNFMCDCCEDCEQECRDNI